MTSNSPGTTAALPSFAVRIARPDLDRWRPGNTGVPGFTSLAAAAAGPHVVLLSLMHGNEYAGAIVLDRMLRAGVRPRRGRLTFGFVNLAAFDAFVPENPTASRFVDEDINRLWDPDLIAGTRRSVELDRVREIVPLIDTADVVLDLHSMLWPSDPLILSGATARGRDLACALGAPRLVVADQGHAAGPRLIDYPRFADPGAGPCAILVEAGQHWEQATVHMAAASVAGILHHLDMVTDHPALPPPTRAKARVAEVTDVVTASTASFAFVRGYRGGEVIPQRNTLIALDGTIEIRTHYDDCLLVMPSLRPSRGHTAVRLARFVAA
jgi:predicted deacylase